MTRALAIVAGLLALACLVLGLMWAAARADAARAQSTHAAQITQARADLAKAKASVRTARIAAATSSAAYVQARAQLATAQTQRRIRVYVEKVREAQTLAAPPTAAGARASLVDVGGASTQTSTLALTWAAMARWRRVAGETTAQMLVLEADRDTQAARADAAEATSGLIEARANERIAGLDVALAEAQAQIAGRVSRTRRTVSVVSVAAAAAGIVGGSVGLALCRSAQCRKVAGLGGGGLALAGGTVAVLSW